MAEQQVLQRNGHRNGVGPRSTIPVSVPTTNLLDSVSPTLLLIVRYGIVKPILSIIWAITHFIYVLIHNVDLVNSFQTWMASGRSSKQDMLILTKTNQFEKFPNHVVIAVHNYDDGIQNITQLSRIICWAWVANIKVISLYEPKGIVKSQAKKLYRMVEEGLQETCRELKTAGIVGNKTTPPILTFYNTGDEEMDKLSNGTQKPDEAISQQQSLPIYFCCEKDCKSGIVNAARNLFEKKANAKPTLSLPEALFNKDLDAATLNSAINKQIGWPESEPNSEPDLMMVFGNIKSTLGFLPWHIRLTEIHWLPPIQKISPLNFYGSLEKYSKVEQRLGK